MSEWWDGQSSSLGLFLGALLDEFVEFRVEIGLGFFGIAGEVLIEVLGVKNKSEER